MNDQLKSMIKFDLVCENGHIFEASFDDSASFEKQRKKNQIECPFCNSSKISKSVMAPNVANKSTSSSKITVSYTHLRAHET